MRIVLQRVSRASVEVAGETVGEIGHGLLALVGIAEGDDEAVAERAAERTAALRIFPDERGRFDRSVLQAGGAVLVVSQFTLLADTRKGTRPSFTDAAAPERAAPLVDRYRTHLGELGLATAAGRFGADMDVRLTNDGPVTIVLDVTP